MDRVTDSCLVSHKQPIYLLPFPLLIVYHWSFLSTSPTLDLVLLRPVPVDVLNVPDHVLLMNLKEQVFHPLLHYFTTILCMIFVSKKGRRRRED